MIKYTVKLYTFIDVEAENENEAIHQAIEILEDEIPPDKAGKYLDAEITDIEEI